MKIHILRAAIVLLILPFAIALTQCGSDTTASDVEEYLVDVHWIMDEAADIASKVSALYTSAANLSVSEILQRCVTYKDDYKNLQGRLMILETPSECSQLRMHLMDTFTYCQQELTEFAAAYSTGDISRLFEAERYYDKANRAILLAATEWERLSGD